ncbi:MAG TPA: DUF559 domain-containing protein [Jatrophihabitans sp.]|uniref:DUF559 domain-containing protein n=1 Tax=Jatrophihabitans sp. TaxID=1932789 RepID=UPI002DF9EC17|nr:DUF559 domain-containing protein [Jatrophihabitans sp.]
MPDIDRLLARCGGALSRDLLVRAGLDRHAIDSEVRRGGLVAAFPRAYCRPWEVDQPDVRELAAVMSLGHPVALSHLTALRRWGLASAPPQVHVSVLDRRNPRGGPDLAVHRVAAFPPVARVDRQLVVRPAFAIASSWPLQDAEHRRAAAITAVRRRLVTPESLRGAVAQQPRLAGRRELLSLVELLDAGCESELEIWGHLHVFDVPGLDHATPQKWVQADGRWYRLDRAYEAERVAIEMDGARYHDQDEGQRERDRCRDTALASIDWITLRFSHTRLHRDVAGCRRHTYATLAARGVRPPRQ